jgi:Protein of unknown function (DUF3455)
MKHLAPFLAAALAGCSAVPLTPAAPPAPLVPAALQPPSGERKAFEHFARGVQIYRCAPPASTAGAAAPTWAFVAPRAQLFSAASSTVVVGTHGAGPHWQANDGSKVVGQVKARADATQAGAIPWLLLATTAEGAPGAMAPVTSIQRLNTSGGAAPGSGCAAAADVGKEAEVPYTATYAYFVRG